jgi:hypothetical protein
VLLSALRYVWVSYLRGLYYEWSPVSYPGDAKTVPLERLGSWPDRETKAPAGWTLLTAEASHAATEAAWGGKLQLTGEAAGRQLWVHDDDAAATAGDSKHTFNPAKNPNGSDKLMRSQLQAKWQGAKPDEDEVPSSAAAAARKGIAYFQMMQCDDGHWGGDYGECCYACSYERL